MLAYTNVTGNERMALSICMKCGKTKCLKKMLAQSLLNTGMLADQNAMKQNTKNRKLITICMLLNAQGQWVQEQMLYAKCANLINTQNKMLRSSVVGKLLKFETSC